MHWLIPLSSWCLLAVLPCAIAARSTFPDATTEAAALTAWESDILALDTRNQLESHPAHAILFIGSSSIRLWNSIVSDMAPYHPIQRGYGGAKFSDLAVFAQRLMAPHAFRALVVFVANDVTGSQDDPDPGQVAAWFSHVVDVACELQPQAVIFCMEITPTPARWLAWPKIRETNLALARACAARSNVHFIPTANAYIGAEGLPLSDLFQEDQLHLNPLGYRIWSAIIKSHLDSHLR